MQKTLRLIILHNRQNLMIVCSFSSSVDLASTSCWSDAAACCFTCNMTPSNASIFSRHTCSSLCKMIATESSMCLLQGCGAGTQISGSVSTSMHLKFLAPTPTSKSFWLRLQNDLVHQRLKTIVLFLQLTCSQTRLLNGNSNFRLHHSKFLAPAPAIQNCLGSSYGFWLYSSDLSINWSSIFYAWRKPPE